MATKYMLQSELRELNKGFPRIPISTLKKHELEGQIALLKKKREELDSVTPPPVKKGPLPKRPIEIEEQEDDEGNIIRMPKAPAPRPTKPPPRPPAEDGKRLPGRPPKAKEPKEVAFEESEDRPLKGKSNRVTYCGCNCPSCPHKH